MKTFIINNETGALLRTVDAHIPITDCVIIDELSYKVIYTEMNLSMLAEPLLKIFIKI